MLAEDVVLDILAHYLPDLHATTLIEQDVPPPYALVRRSTFLSTWDSDERFMDRFYFSVDLLAGGIDADTDAPLILSAIATVLRRAAYAKYRVGDYGWVQEARVVEPPRRRADWANSEGPVQYADLPHRYVRYAAVFQIAIKKARVGPNVYDY